MLTQAGQVASTPYQAYSGQLVAPTNSQQDTGISGINQYAGFAQPYIQQAAGYANQAAQPLTAAQIQQYQSPYTQQVVDATQAQFNNQDAQQQNQLLGNAAQQGALGGNRVGVAQANLAGQQQLAQNPVIAGLYNQGYSTALQTAEQQQQNLGQAAYSLGNLGVAGQQAGLTGAGAQVGAGSLQQQTQQAQDTAAYQQYMQQLAYPFQTTQWLAGLDTGVGSQMGGTSSGTSTTPAPNQTAQYAGLGLAAAGMFLNRGGRVPGFDSGGGVSGTPYAGVSGWVPSMNIASGHGAPNAPGLSAPSQQQSQVNPLQMANQVSGLAKSLNGTFGGDNLVSQEGATYGAPAVAGQDMTYGSMGGVAVPTFRAKGGGVRGYDDGGLVSGLGDYVPPTFDQRFAGAPSSADNIVTGGVDPSVDPVGSYAASKIAPIADKTPVAGFEAPPIAPVSDNSDYFSSGVPVSVGKSAGFGTPSAPITGSQPIPPAAAQDISAPTQGYADSVNSLSHAVKSVESGGNYQALGPQTKTGDRAYGAYQVMGANIPQWTKEVLGQSLTPQQFLASSLAQDTVARAKLGQYANKYGPEGAARAWFAGEGGMNNLGAKDSLGTDVAGYGAKVMAALNGPQNGTNRQIAGVGDDNSQLPPQAQPAQYRPDDKKGGLLSSLGIDLSPAARQGLMAAGFGMAASRSPFLGNAIGEGGMQGMQTYAGARTAEQAQRKVDLESRRLDQAANQAQQKIDLDTRKANVSDLQPVKIGMDGLGREIYGVRDPSTGQLKPIDPVTGSVNGPSASSPPANQITGDLTHGEEYLKTLPQTQASQVRALAEGRMAFPSGFAASKPYWQGMLQSVMQYDPSADATNLPTRSATRKDFTSGKSAISINAMNTVLGHLESLSDNADALKNSWSPAWNSVANAVVNQTGDPRIKQFDTTKKAVVDELTRVWRGAGGSEGDIKTWSEQINSANSPAQLHGVIHQMGELLHSKINSMGEQYKQGMGTSETPIRLLTPQSQKVLDKLDARDGGQPEEKQTVTPHSTLNGTDKAALDWANANPADQRAAAIKQKLGIQ